MFISHEELFLKTIDDLRNKVASDDDYNLVRAAGLCRHLLTDSGKPLVKILDRKYGVKIEFTVASLSMVGLQMANLSMVWTTISPNHLSDPVKVGLKDFLAIQFLRIENHIYSVKDVIRAASHCMGGIHSGVPKDEKEKALHDIEPRVVGGHKTTHHAITSICNVVISAMEPLEAAIKGIPQLQGL
ncbi:MAG: hypothetical protein IPQ06_09540 [Chitinophagaceae bacterium]|nr:hypothetical protein [Chitinophagaceae bacterium]